MSQCPDHLKYSCFSDSLICGAKLHPPQEIGCHSSWAARACVRSRACQYMGEESFLTLFCNLWAVLHPCALGFVHLYSGASFSCSFCTAVKYGAPLKVWKRCLGLPTTCPFDLQNITENTSRKHSKSSVKTVRLESLSVGHK